MEQPVPKVTARDVGRVIRRDFDPDEQSEVHEMLHSIEEARIQLAILKLAACQAEAIPDLVKLAQIDYRDVLAAAEYPHYMRIAYQEMQQLPKEEQNAIIKSDWDQYQNWLLSDGCA